MNRFLIVIDGPMGSGKTTVSRLIHEEVQGAALITLSAVKHFISGFEKNHEYNKISQEVILVMANEYLNRDISIIVEWAMRKDKVASFREIAEKHNAKFLFYQLDAPKKLLLERVRNRVGTISNKTEPEQENIIDKFERNYNFYSENKYESARIFDSEKLKPQEIAEIVLRDLN